MPELIDEKPKYYFLIVTGFFFYLFLNLLTFSSKYFLNFTKILGLVDNIFCLLYFLASFLFCFLTYNILYKISSNKNTKDDKYLFFKKMILIFMFMNLCSYILSLLIVSFYNPIIFSEKILFSFLILLINLNSTFFLIMQYTFIFTLKYDLYYVNLNLEVQPDMEYFFLQEELMNNLKKNRSIL